MRNEAWDFFFCTRDRDRNNCCYHRLMVIFHIFFIFLTNLCKGFLKSQSKWILMSIFKTGWNSCLGAREKVKCQKKAKLSIDISINLSKQFVYSLCQVWCQCSVTNTITLSTLMQVVSFVLQQYAIRNNGICF